MTEIIVIGVIWIAVIICIAIMQAVDRDNKIYPIYAVAMAIVFTVYTLYTKIGQ